MTWWSSSSHCPGMSLRRWDFAMIVSPSQISSEKVDQIQGLEERSRIQKQEEYYRWFCCPKSLRQSHRTCIVTETDKEFSKGCLMPELQNSNSWRTSCMTRVGMCHMWYWIQVPWTKGHEFVMQRCKVHGSRAVTPPPLGCIILSMFGSSNGLSHSRVSHATKLGHEMVWTCCGRRKHWIHGKLC